MTVSSLKSGYRGDSMLAGNPDPGGMVALQTITVGAGGAASITFDNIPQTYSHLQVRAILASSTTQDAWFRINGDSGYNYANHYLNGNGSSAGSGSATSGSPYTGGYTLKGSNVSNVFGVGIVDILDYTNISKNKVVRSLTGRDYNGSGEIVLFSSVWLSTNAITSLTFMSMSGSSPSGTFAQYSQFALYGIKGVGQ